MPSSARVKLDHLMWSNTAWRFNHRNGLPLESFHGLDRDIELFYMCQHLEGWEAEQHFLRENALANSAQ